MQGPYGLLHFPGSVYKFEGHDYGPCCSDKAQPDSGQQAVWDQLSLVMLFCLLQNVQCPRGHRLLLFVEFGLVGELQ